MTTDGRWIQADMVNRVTSAPALYGDALAWRLDGTMFVYRTEGEVRTIVGAQTCPLDQFSPLGSGMCVQVRLGSTWCASLDSHDAPGAMHSLGAVRSQQRTRRRKRGVHVRPRLFYFGQGVRSMHNAKLLLPGQTVAAHFVPRKFCYIDDIRFTGRLPLHRRILSLRGLHVPPMPQQSMVSLRWHHSAMSWQHKWRRHDESTRLLVSAPHPRRSVHAVRRRRRLLLANRPAAAYARHIRHCVGASGGRRNNGAVLKCRVEAAHRDILRSGAPHVAARQRRAPMGMGRGLGARRRSVVERHLVPRQSRLLIPRGQGIGSPAPDRRRESRNQVDSSWCTRFILLHLMHPIHLAAPDSSCCT
jgi:hypothetical protein